MLPKLTFSFDYFSDKCLDKKIKGEYFTNKVSKKEKNCFFARVFSVLKGYSNYTLIELQQKGLCFGIKAEDKSLKRLVEVLQEFGYKEEWMTKTFHLNPFYKIKIVSGNIRMFGYYSGSFHVLFFDPHHLIEPDDKFGVPDNLVCTWCIKGCGEKQIL